MNTTAVILAGGEGKRFFPLTTDKTLFPFFSRPIISYIIDNLLDIGIKDVIIVTSGVNHEAIKNLSKKNQPLKIVSQTYPKGMADALLSANKFISGKPILVLNAHDIVEPRLFKKIKIHLGGKTGFVVAKRQNEYFEGGYLKFSHKNKQLIGIVEKPGRGKEPSELINLIYHYYPDANRILELIKTIKSKRDDLYEKALTRLIQRQDIKTIIYDGKWQALKFPWHILEMTELFLKSKLKEQNKADKIANSADIEGKVYLGKGVKVLENAVIKGPCYIGDNTIIGNSTLIIKSMIAENCVIGFSSEVSRSYVGNNTWLHTNYIGDSVLEGNNYFGAGAVTANFRFDESNIYSQISGELVNSKKNKLGAILARGAKVGVNASLMPGVKIGKNAIVGPSIVQYKDVQPEQKSF